MNNKKYNGLRSVSNFFPKEVKNLLRKRGFFELELLKNWINIVDKKYIKTSLPIKLKSGTSSNGAYLVVIVDPSNAFGFEHDKDKIKPSDYYTPLYKNSKNMRIIQDAMFGSTNEVMGTSYRSRIDDPKYQFAGKTGTAQVKKITEEERELELKTFQIPYEQRDHALYIAYGPYINPRYALSVLVEHGGNGSTTAAPIAKKLFKLIIDRHIIRKSIENKKYLEI